MGFNFTWCSKRDCSEKYKRRTTITSSLVSMQCIAGAYQYTNPVSTCNTSDKDKQKGSFVYRNCDVYPRLKSMCTLANCGLNTVLVSLEPALWHYPKRPPTWKWVKLYISLLLGSFQQALMISMSNTHMPERQRAGEEGRHRADIEPKCRV